MKNSWFTETEVYLLHEIVARLDRLARQRVLDEKGISYAEFLVAMAVREMPQPTHGEVGALLDMSKSSVSQRVAGLLAKGMVVQRRHAENRREVRLELTAAGKETLEEVYRELADRASSIFDTLGPSRSRFRRLLHRLQNALSAEEALGLQHGRAERPGKDKRSQPNVGSVFSGLLRAKRHLTNI